jgi:hypothetical protein
MGLMVGCDEDACMVSSVTDEEEEDDDEFGWYL